MSDTRKILVVTDNRTIIKKIKIGAPIRNVSLGGQTAGALSDVDTNNQTGGDVLIYQPSNDTYYSAQIASGTNISVTYDSDTKDLTVATALDSLTGSIIPDSNEVYDLGSSSKKFRDLYLSGATLNLGGLKLKDSNGSFVVTDSADNTVFTEVSLTTDNANMLSFDSASGMFTFRANGFTVDSATIGGINLSGNDLTTTGKLYFSNVFSNIGDLPSASTYHGMFAHVHGTGSAYFAHAGNWVKLLDSDGYILSAGTGLNYDSANRQFSLANTGVTAASYGSSTTVPQISINAQGQIDSARNITIAGVTGVDFDSASGTITIQTTGGDFSDVITLDPYSTSNLVEGSNLYYTTARADSAFDVRLATKSTSNLVEGSNLYYTTTRADSDAKNAISVTDAGGDGSLTYNSANGVITYTGPSAAEIRAHFQAGTGVTYDSASGTLSIGQGVGTSDNVTFNNLVVSGNLTVSGTETTVNTETINLADNEIVLKMVVSQFAEVISLIKLCCGMKQQTNGLSAQKHLLREHLKVISQVM
jgi:phage baseplate assembly protein gpV